MTTIWTPGDVSASQTLADNDHLYPGHINEIRSAVNTLEDAPTVDYPSDFARQLLVNGNFDIWQRQVTFTNLTTGNYWADKHKLAFDIGAGTLPTITITRQELAANDLWGSNYYTRFAFSGAGSVSNASYYTFYNTSIIIPKYFQAGTGRYLTYSFMAKSNIAGKRIGTSLGIFYGWGGASTSVVGSPFTLTSEWVKYTTIFALPSLSGVTWADDVHNLIIPKVYMAWGSSVASECGATTAETFGGAGNVEITQQQLSFSNGALQFYPRSFQQEYLDCLYYYRKSYQYNEYPGDNTEKNIIEVNGAIGTSGSTYHVVNFDHSMRLNSTPSITIYDNATNLGKVSFRNYAGSVTSNITAGVDNVTPKGFRIGATGSAADHHSMMFHYVANADV